MKKAQSSGVKLSVLVLFLHLVVDTQWFDPLVSLSHVRLNFETYKRNDGDWANFRFLQIAMMTLSWRQDITTLVQPPKNMFTFLEDLRTNLRVLIMELLFIIQPLEEVGFIFNHPKI